MDAAESGGHANLSLAVIRDRELKQFLPVCLCSSELECKTLDKESTGVRVHSLGLRVGGESGFVPDNLHHLATL